MTPTARSLANLRGRGFLVARVEQRLPIPGKFVTRDCFGFGDLLACGTEEHIIPATLTTMALSVDERVIVLVQATSMSNLAAREKKVRTLPEAKRWLEMGGHILLHGWSKKGKRGERKLWTLTERRIEDL